MGIKRRTIPKAKALTITISMIGDLIAGRGRGMGVLLDGKPAFADEEHRRRTWQLFKAKVYQTMHVHNPKLQHPAAYYEYETFTEEELEKDLPYLYSGLILSDGTRTYCR